MGEVSKGEIKLDEIRELEEDRKIVEEAEKQAESDVFSEYLDESELSEDDIERILSSGLRSEFLEELMRRKKEIAKLKQIQLELNRKMAEYLYLKMTYDKLEEKSRTVRDVWKDTPENRTKMSKLLNKEYINRKVSGLLDGMEDPSIDLAKAGNEAAKKHQKDAVRHNAKGIAR